jgi:GTP-binding protein
VPKTPNFTWITVINTPNKSQKLNFKSTEFLQSASALSNAPADFGCEVAFAGRSNAGKSSAINALTGNSKLARTSRTPGRTQLINFFTVSDQVRLVDLPGYGFAKVPLKVKNEWNKQLERYLQHRRSLKGLILLMDIRHPLKDYDRQMIEWATVSEMPVHILLTKCDKLKRGPAKTALLGVKKELKAHEKWVSAQLFSSQNHEGMADLHRTLNWWLTLPDEDVMPIEDNTPD